jgi:ArsR family transcriptional regulator
MLQAPTCCTNLTDFLAPDLFKALSDPNRVILLSRLAQSGAEQTVSQVATCCSVDLSVVSRHLKTLKDAGIVACEKRGKEVFYRVRIDELVGLLRGLADALESCCPDGRCPPAGAR